MTVLGSPTDQGNWLEYAERLYIRFPDIFKTLGNPDLPQAYHLPESGLSSVRILNYEDKKVVQVSLESRHPSQTGGFLREGGAFGSVPESLDNTPHSGAGARPHVANGGSLPLSPMLHASAGLSQPTTPFSYSYSSSSSRSQPSSLLHPSSSALAPAPNFQSFMTASGADQNFGGSIRKVASIGNARAGFRGSAFPSEYGPDGETGRFQNSGGGAGGAASSQAATANGISAASAASRSRQFCDFSELLGSLDGPSSSCPTTPELGFAPSPKGSMEPRKIVDADDHILSVVAEIEPVSPRSPGIFSPWSEPTLGTGHRSPIDDKLSPRSSFKSEGEVEAEGAPRSALRKSGAFPSGSRKISIQLPVYGQNPRQAQRRPSLPASMESGVSGLSDFDQPAVGSNQPPPVRMTFAAGQREDESFEVEAGLMLVRHTFSNSTSSTNFLPSPRMSVCAQSPSLRMRGSLSQRRGLQPLTLHQGAEAKGAEGLASRSKQEKDTRRRKLMSGGLNTASPENHQSAVQLMSPDIGTAGNSFKGLADNSLAVTRVASPLLGPAKLPHHLPGAFPNHKTVFFFDWDDTLCPTTWIRRLLKDTLADMEEWVQTDDMQEAEMDWRDQIPSWFSQPLPEDTWVQDCVFEFQQAVIHTINAAQAMGVMCIVTNAVEGWVEKTVMRWLPHLKPYIHGHGSRPPIKILYGQREYKAYRSEISAPFVDYLGEHMWWKHAAMKCALEEVDSLYRLHDNSFSLSQEVLRTPSWCSSASAKRWVNVVSIGDNDAEMQAPTVASFGLQSKGCGRGLWSGGKEAPCLLGSLGGASSSTRTTPGATSTSVERSYFSPVLLKALEMEGPSFGPSNSGPSTDWFLDDLSTKPPPLHSGRLRERRHSDGGSSISGGRGEGPWVKLVKLRELPHIRQLRTQLDALAEMIPNIAARREHLRLKLDDICDDSDCLSPRSPLLLKDRLERMFKGDFSTVSPAELALRTQTV